MSPCALFGLFFKGNEQTTTGGSLESSRDHFESMSLAG